jgi:hypothetical protein
MQNDDAAKRCNAALNKLAKWRSVLAGWQLGTRAKGDPECDAVRDHREVTIMLRAEVSALTALLVEKGIFTPEEFQQALIDEAQQLEKDYERHFPGIRSTDIGMQFDVKEASETMKGWRP